MRKKKFLLLTGQVRDRVRDVVVGHREDRELRDRAGAALDAPRALVDGREVGVPVLRKKSFLFFWFFRGEQKKKKMRKNSKKTQKEKYSLSLLLHPLFQTTHMYPGYPLRPGTSSRAADTSRSASAYELMSVRMTKTCLPHS